MSIQNFPSGITSFGVPVIGAQGIPATTGKYFFVSSVTGSNSNPGKNPNTPVATIASAVAKCTANKADVVVVMPGHAETLASAGALTVNKAGVTIIGLGTGSLRPTLTWSATDSTLAVTAANVTISNCITTISIDEVVSMFNITGANCLIDRVDFQPYGALGATGQALQWLTSGTAAHYLTIQNCKHYPYTAAKTTQVWINLHTLTAPRVLNNVASIVGMAHTNSHWIGSAGACTQVEIANNRVVFLGGTITGVITLTTGTTGLIYNNFIASGTAVGVATVIAADAAYVFENYWHDKAATSGFLSPVTGAEGP